jgi:hypothetical protein
MPAKQVGATVREARKDARMTNDESIGLMIEILEPIQHEDDWAARLASEWHERTLALGIGETESSALLETAYASVVDHASQSGIGAN